MVRAAVFLCGRTGRRYACPFKNVVGDRRLVPAVAQTPASVRCTKRGRKEMRISLQRVEWSGVEEALEVRAAGCWISIVK